MRDWTSDSAVRGRARRGIRSLAVAVVCSLVLSGCFLQSIVGWVDEDGGATLSGNLEVGFCNFDTTLPQFYGCTYIIRGEGDRLLDVTSTFQLISEFGVFGLIIDPLVLQVPADATNVVATYNNAGADLPLVVTEATSFAATPTVVVAAEPATKFLILELPDAAAAALPPGRSEIDFSLSFDVADPANLLVKPMLTARVDHGGVRYYVPVFPCVTSFAGIPAVQIPVATDFQFLNPAFDPFVNNAATFACNQVVYDFDAATTPTATPVPSPTADPGVNQPAPQLESPTIVPTPTPDPTPTAAPTATPAEAPAPPAAPQLAFSGASSDALLRFALASIAFGAAACAAGVRRSQRPR